MLSAVAALLLANAPATVDDGATVLTEEELEAVPAAISGHFAALPLLPGASPLLSPFATSAIRGKQPSTVGVFLDGVELPTAQHLLLGPPVLQDASVATLAVDRGAAPIEHGRLLGGAVRIGLAAPSRPGLHGTTSLDLLRAGTLNHWMDEGGATKVSAGASLAWTPFVYSRLSSGATATLADYLARVEQRAGQGKLRLLALGAQDAVGTASAHDSVGGALTFHRVDLRGEHPLAGGEARAAITFGWDRVGALIGGAVAQSEALVTQTTFSARASWTKQVSPAASLRLGADASRRAADLAQLWTAAPPRIEDAPEDDPIEAGVRAPIANALLTGAWAEAALSDDPQQRFTLGLRVDNYHLVPGRNLLAVEPRVKLWRALSPDVALRAGVALVHQAPTFLLPLPGVELASLRFGLQQALRVDGGLSIQMALHTVATIDVYVDPLFRTLELSPLDRDFLQTVKASHEELSPSHVQSGIAYGAELMLRRQFADGWFGWVSWTYQRSERDTRYVLRNDFGEPVDSRMARLPVGFVHEHAASAVAGRTFGRWTLSGAAHFHTGAPEVGGLSSTTQREGRDRLRPGPRWIEADRVDAAYLPPFFRLDARVAYAFEVGPVGLTASLDVQNLTFGRELNRFSYREEADSLADRDAGRVRLVRTPGSLLPGIPFPMVGLAARY